MIEITKNDIYQFLKEKDAGSKFSVVYVVDDISEMVMGDTYTQEEYISVTCKVSYYDETRTLVSEDRKCCIDKVVLENYMREKKSVTWYE